MAVSTPASPEISVIMGVHNERYPGAVDRAVESILRQQFRELELILYDDGSAPLVSERLRSLAGRDGRIVVLGDEARRGLAWSLNACLRVARGHYIARMDADDISLPGRLTREREYLDSHPGIAWVGCNAGVFDSRGEWGFSTRPEKPALRDYMRYSPFIHPTVMIRRSVLEQIGGYDTDGELLRLEDYELFLRLFHEGYCGVNLQEELYLYYVDRETGHARSWQLRLKEIKLRFDYFRRLGVLLPAGWMYCLRPVAGGLVPPGILRRFKKKRRQL